MRAWWQTEVAYQIYPKSFKDTNHDGIGDLKGIIEKLDYLKDLGIGIIWLSPIYQSPQKDNGYDVSDYLNIDPIYGTLEDMDELIYEAKKRDIKIIMDLVLNHTSDQHDWFMKSRQKIEPYKDYYIWKDGIGGNPPNNWTSFFYKQAWTYDEVRKQYYLHLFAKEQPDLNYQNEKVIEEIKRIMIFWLDRGIKGFRVDASNVIYKTSLGDGEKNTFIGTEHFLAQEGNHVILERLRREVLDHYDCFTVGEAGMINFEQARLFCDPSRHELNMLFSFEHMETHHKGSKWNKKKLKPKHFFSKLKEAQEAIDWNPIFFENHDQVRSVSQFGNQKKYHYESATALALLLLTLKGTPFIYQGQEIGMTNFDYQSLDEIDDIECLNAYQNFSRFIPKFMKIKKALKGSRDNVRTPMQWNHQLNAGFSNQKPWLNVIKNYKQINVEAQLKDHNSILSFYKRLIQFRNSSDTLKYGEFKSIKIDRHKFVYKMSFKKDYLIVINLSAKKLKNTFDGKMVMSNYSNKTEIKTIFPYEAFILEV
jgi:oligo-1,6-glucosidase